MDKETARQIIIFANEIRELPAAVRLDLEETIDPQSYIEAIRILDN